MDNFTQGALSGIAVGSVFALAAVGFSLFYSASRVLNLAHGAVIMLVGLSLSTLFGSDGSPYMAVVVAVLLGAALSTAAYLLLLHPVRKRPQMMVVAITLGVLFLSVGAGNVWWGPNVRFLRRFSTTQVVVPGGVLTGHEIATIAVAVMATAATMFWLRRTMTGKALRAVAEDLEGAQVVGINPTRAVAIAAAASGALAGLAAALIVPSTGMAPDFAGRLTLFATAAAILGGLGRVDGALVGGMLLGIVNGVTQAVDPHWFNVVQFALLLLVLTLLPQGLLGSRKGRIGTGR